MGLLERALSYKQKLNDKGKETLIDRIKGPAESTFTHNSINTVNVNEIDDITAVKNVDDTEIIPEDIRPVDIKIIDDGDKAHYFNREVDHDEEIILFNEPAVADLDKDTDTDNETIIIDDLLDEEAEKPRDIKPEDGFIPSKAVVQESADDVAETTVDPVEDSSFDMPEFGDYSVLFELQKEFIKAESVEDIYKTVLFAIMGQIGVSSASILGASDDKSKWIILDSNGIEIDSEERTWDPASGILTLLDSFRGILDIEDLKTDVNLRDDYYKFVSVDARIITPLVYKDLLAGAILVGEKINSNEFTPADMLFLLTVTDMASDALSIILQFEEINVELLGLRIEKEIMWDVEILQNMILDSASAKDLNEILQKNFFSLGIESYTIFMNDPASGTFFPAYYEKEDILGFNDSGFRIKKDNKLINFYLNKKASMMVENFEESAVLTETFGRDRLKKMEVFISYPFIISGRLSGFIAITKINPAVEMIDVDMRLQKIVMFLFPYISRILDLDPTINIYNDLTGILYGRIESELNRSSEMKIPLSLVMVSIKNFKRFHDRFGRIELNRLFEKISVIVKSKLYAADFSVRVDRHRFLLVLPGKDRKYSTMLANILKNEIADLYNNSDFKLLVSSIISVYPDDGKDLFTLLDVLE
ncbi:MAG TPA: diguanylate cyclase [Spirochaetota bacterium]|nr:diguanylate cyclase [Spirochaetota bacterium]